MKGISYSLGWVPVKLAYGGESDFHLGKAGLRKAVGKAGPWIVMETLLEIPFKNTFEWKRKVRYSY